MSDEVKLERFAMLEYGLNVRSVRPQRVPTLVEKLKAASDAVRASISYRPAANEER